jgi:hypothetical protein
MKRNLNDPSPERPDLLGIGLASLLIITLGFSILAVLSMIEPGQPRFSRSIKVTPTSTVIKAVPTQDCGELEMLFADKKFQIREVDSADQVPTTNSDENTVYWLSRFSPALVFSLAGSPEFSDLAKSIQEGDLVTIQWPTCEVESYIMSAPKFGATFDPSEPGDLGQAFILYASSDSEKNRFVLTGSPLEFQLVSTEIPANQNVQVEAEISIHAVSISSNQKEIRVDVSIFNYGSSPISLTKNDIRMTAEDQPASAPEKSKPSLPLNIKAGATHDLTLTFSNPPDGGWKLQIFNTEFDLEDYL